MGNNKQKKPSSFSIFSIFTARKGRNVSCDDPPSPSAKKIYRSDADKRHGLITTGDHKVDNKAEEYINKIRKSYFMASESQTACA